MIAQTACCAPYHTQLRLRVCLNMHAVLPFQNWHVVCGAAMLTEYLGQTRRYQATWQLTGKLCAGLLPA